MTQNKYQGYEVGPIRPPSEAASLMLRITRNCPWNKCTFCTLYKGKKFTVRSREDILQDIDCLKLLIDSFEGKTLEKEKLRECQNSENFIWVARNWYENGMESVFLQDANSLLYKPADLIEILRYLRKQFPIIQRITSYARSHTIARINDENLHKMKEAGLNRIHIGLESGNDKILSLIEKGVDKKTHILAGQKLKKAGIELSEYYMPGLGGKEYWKENAIETADALNQINPEFIRIRTLAVLPNSPLAEDYQNGTFTKMNDVEVVKELLLCIENLNGITSMIKSDHILNLLPEVEGKLPDDKEKIIEVLNWFLCLSKKDKMIYRIGRRSLTMHCRDDLNVSKRRKHVENLIVQYNVTPENIDKIIDKLMNRFV
jgi:radical SAM superfamily enzyme YgiQ (UPF0313 family)